MGGTGRGSLAAEGGMGSFGVVVGHPVGNDTAGKRTLRSRH